MIPREILKKIRQIEIRTNRLVSETLAGQYHSVFKGQGMNFDEVREYQPGDDVRAIDWNVTARMNHPFIKKFVEERELTVILVVDLSGSGLFGSVTQSKRELAAEIASVLAFSAILRQANRRHDLVAVQITDRFEQELPALGRLVLKDAETGEVVEINTGDERKRAAFAQRHLKTQAELLKLFRSARIDSIQLRTDQPYAAALGRFFEMRESRRRHG